MSFAQVLARLSDMFGGNVPLSNRNYIVDGAFTINDIAYPSPQTVTAGTAQQYRVCAMWLSAAGAGGQAGLTQAVASPGVIPSYGFADDGFGIMQWNQTTASTGTVSPTSSSGPLMSHRIESVRTLAGRSATFSILIANTGASPFTIPAVYTNQAFGSGGSPSASVLYSRMVNWLIPADGKWRRFSVRLDIPSISGMTIGTNANDYIQVYLGLPVGATFSFSTTCWQLEASNPNSSGDLNGAGGAPTAFEWRGAALESARVNRYIEWNFVGIAGWQAYASDTNRNWTITYKASKRGTPALTLNTLSPSGTPSVVANGLGGIQLNYAAGNTTSAFSFTGYVADARL